MRKKQAIHFMLIWLGILVAIAVMAGGLGLAIQTFGEDVVGKTLFALFVLTLTGFLAAFVEWRL